MEDAFFDKFLKIVSQNLQNPDLSNVWLANQLMVSERSLYVRIHKETGGSPHQIIRKLKLKRAKELASSGKYQTVKDLCLAAGYQKTEYFSAIFEQEFGVRPKEILKNRK